VHHQAGQDHVHRTVVALEVLGHAERERAVAEAGTLTADPDVGEAARSTIQRVATALTELLTRGQETSDVHRDLDPVAGAWWLLSLLAARTFRTAISSDPAMLERRLAAMTVHLLTTTPGAINPTA
jgi:hypothetical protein